MSGGELVKLRVQAVGERMRLSVPVSRDVAVIVALTREDCREIGQALLAFAGAGSERATPLAADAAGGAARSGHGSAPPAASPAPITS